MPVIDKKRAPSPGRRGGSSEGDTPAGRAVRRPPHELALMHRWLPAAATVCRGWRCHRVSTSDSRPYLSESKTSALRETMRESERWLTRSLSLGISSHHLV